MSQSANKVMERKNKNVEIILEMPMGCKCEQHFVQSMGVTSVGYSKQQIQEMEMNKVNYECATYSASLRRPWATSDGVVGDPSPHTYRCGRAGQKRSR